MKIKSKIFKEKIENQTIKIGLSAAAVLLTLSDAALKAFLAFPDPHDSINKALKNFHSLSPTPFKEYFDELKEISGFNLRMILLRLERKGLISRTSGDHKLTPRGREFMQRLKAKIEHNSKWDGKWHLVTFDVPEKKRYDRAWLRSVLSLSGYEPLHKSVFLGKFALPEEIYREIYSRKLKNYVKLLTVGEIDEES